MTSLEPPLSQKDDLTSKVDNLEKLLEKEKEEKKQMENVIFTLKEVKGYRSLFKQIVVLQVNSRNRLPQMDKWASLEEVDSELILVREELQKVWDMLKTKDSELEEQNLELESARGQYTECSTEKARLEQMVSSLQQQLTETEQSLKHLKQLREMEKTEMDIERSSLELKLAEMQMQNENVSYRSESKSFKLNPNEKQSEVSSQICSRCEIFMQQLDKAIQECQGHNMELQKEKSQTLVCLHQLQEVVKDLSKQTKVNEQVAQVLRVDNESLKNQHKLVTEQLKGLFKERNKLTKAYAKLPKEEISAEEWAKNSKLVKNVLSSVKAHEMGEEDQEHDIRNLQRQLAEKSEMISKMTSEIKVLQEKNESLMKAKLRFQQQVQQIRSVSQPDRKRDVSDPVVPRLSVDNETVSRGSPSGIRERLDTLESQDSSAPTTDYQTSLQSTSEGSCTTSSLNSRTPTPISTRNTPTSLMRLGLPVSQGKKWRRSPEESPLSPRSQVDSEASSDTHGSLTPRASALLSPRPYRPHKSGQVFRFGES
ncbi:myosin-2 heavy chain-like [Bombina bombina]|uniref:myosin-2 heavy chain-like n=1 Tax=Bombina bombina TaxID=8345 RepID=UPI00235B25FF|nr:myosin-2 heavy chain-like [Bombina bombina]